MDGSMRASASMLLWYLSNQEMQVMMHYIKEELSGSIFSLPFLVCFRLSIAHRDGHLNFSTPLS